MKGLEPPTNKKRKVEGGKVRGKGGHRKGSRGGGAGPGPGMHVVVSGQFLFYPYHSWLSYV